MSLDRIVGGFSFVSSTSLALLGFFGLYFAFTNFTVDTDFALFLVVHCIFFVASSLFCFLAELRLEKLRYFLSSFGFLHSRQGRGWFTVFLGLLVVFLPLDVERPWITKVCGSLQLFAGLLLLLIAYVGGLREDMFGPGRVKEVGSKGPNVIEWKGGDTSWDTTSLPKRGGGNPWRKEGSTEEGPSSSEPHQMERGTLNLPSSSGAHDLEGSLEPPPGRGINPFLEAVQGQSK
jgi:hypothetical protein